VRIGRTATQPPRRTGPSVAPPAPPVRSGEACTRSARTRTRWALPSIGTRSRSSATFSRPLVVRCWHDQHVLRQEALRRYLDRKCRGVVVVRVAHDDHLGTRMVERPPERAENLPQDIVRVRLRRGAHGSRAGQGVLHPTTGSEPPPAGPSRPPRWAVRIVRRPAGRVGPPSGNTGPNRRVRPPA